MTSSTEPIDGCCHWSRALDWAYRVLPGKVIAERRGEQHQLLGLASAVWIVLDGPATSGDVRDRIAQAAEAIGPSLHEVEDALGLMQAHGLVRAEAAG